MPLTCVVGGWSGVFELGVANFAKTQQLSKILSIFVITSYCENPHEILCIFMGDKITRSCQE